MTQAREWPNTAKSILDGSAEIFERQLDLLNPILRNEINDEELIEQNIQLVVEDIHLLINVYQKLGASTNPLAKFDNRILQITGVMPSTGTAIVIERNRSFSEKVPA